MSQRLACNRCFRFVSQPDQLALHYCQSPCTFHVQNSDALCYFIITHHNFDSSLTFLSRTEDFHNNWHLTCTSCNFLLGSFCDAVMPCESSGKTPYAWTARSNPLQPDGNLASYRQTPKCSNHILHTSKLVPFALIYRDLDIEIPFLEKPCDPGIKQPTKFPNLILHTCKLFPCALGEIYFLNVWHNEQPCCPGIKKLTKVINQSLSKSMMSISHWLFTSRCRKATDGIEIGAWVGDDQGKWEGATFRKGILIILNVQFLYQ
jgi:hypothetical protein